MGLTASQTVTSGSSPANNELLCYQGLTENQYTAGLAFAASKKMGHEYGVRPEEGFYIKLFPEGRNDALVAQFEAAIK